MDTKVDASFGVGRVIVDVRGLAALSAALARRAARLADLRPLWFRCFEDMARIQRDWFESEGRGSWPQLAESTTEKRTQQLRKRRDGSEYFGGSGSKGKHYSIASNQSPAHKILQWIGPENHDGGGILLSLLVAGSPDSIFQTTAREMTYGTSKDRAVWNNPKRPILAREELRASVARNASEFVRAALTGEDFRVARS